VEGAETAGYDRRPYFRSYNSNRPELQVLRQQANRHRDKLADIWDLSVLDEILPNQAILPFEKDPIRETKRHLNLTGILLWAGENLLNHPYMFGPRRDSTAAILSPSVLA